MVLDACKLRMEFNHWVCRSNDHHARRSRSMDDVHVHCHNDLFINGTISKMELGTPSDYRTLEHPIYLCTYFSLSSVRYINGWHRIFRNFDMLFTHLPKPKKEAHKSNKRNGLIGHFFISLILFNVIPSKKREPLRFSNN